MLQMKHYPSENYSTVFNAVTGFFARIEDNGFPEPFWSEHGPELMDISITGWCDRSCPTCYRNSSPRGVHIGLSDYESIVRQAAKMGVLQIALGGGNPNQHPDFCRILELTRRDYGIVPSYTTNGRGLSPAVIDASVDFCGAVAVSAYRPYTDLKSALRTLIQSGIRTNIHFVLDVESMGTALAWLRKPPSFLDGVNAVIFLNYKPVGRQQSDDRLLSNSQNLVEFFALVQDSEWPFKLGFDSCMVSGLTSFTTIVPSFYDACEAARFSMFISENMLMYPCSFMESTSKGIAIQGDNILDTWGHSGLFSEFRDRLLSNQCLDCHHRSVCMGGCPMFREVNLCRMDSHPPNANRA